MIPPLFTSSHEPHAPTHTDTDLPLDTTSSEALAHALMTLLLDKKGEDCIILDVREKSTFCDFFVIASGNVGRHLVSMADYVSSALKASNLPYGCEGTEQAEWILIDGGNVVVHLFRPEVRERYNLEKMWGSD